MTAVKELNADHVIPATIRACSGRSESVGEKNLPTQCPVMQGFAFHQSHIRRYF